MQTSIYKKKILYIKKSLKNCFNYIKYSYLFNEIPMNSNSKKIFIMGTPEHGNLGDQAIIKAEKDFLNDFFPMYDIIEIPSKMVKFKINELKKKINTDEDIICLHGGGYLGTLWPEEEEMARSVIKNFSNYKIVILPQTLYYEDTEWGKELLMSSIQIYNKHPNLYLCAREEQTYDAFKKYYPNARIFLVPDIVLYLNEINEQSTRNGMLVCFRNDKEAITKNDVKNKLEKLSTKMGLEITQTDTTINKSITKENRDNELEKKFEEFRSAEIVVTDRLHGMIFSVITGTPCVALNNKSGKVKGVYKWIKHLKYVRFIEKAEDLELAIQEVYSLTPTLYENLDLIKEYEPLKEILEK